MYFSKGRVTRQAHVDIPEGTVEEEYAREGFAGRVSHLYRSSPPVDWINIEGPLRPRALHTGKLPGLGPDWIDGRVPFLQNGDVVLAWAELHSEMPYYFRNADGDEVLFVHQGQGRLETDFGMLNYARGDYLVIPRGTVYRLVPTQATKVLVIVTREQVRLPDRGIAGKHALFDPAMMDTPELGPMPKPDAHWQLKVQRLGQITTITYPHNPITTVGWKGDLTVWRINVRDIRPMMSERYHLPPTAHVTFLTDSVVICSFLPRGLETGDEGALKVPFFHSNIDFDEVLFYHDGDFFSREGIDAGMVTFHPQGIHHGPQPGAVKAAHGKQRTNEQAVMVDTRNPLQITEQGESAERSDYWTSWMTPTNMENK
ncbi:MAG: homogentisate 1,2-dioxygenase [Cognaticolwellia sp.]|jgi:homogentisate 1,2-dioxygenase